MAHSEDNRMVRRKFLAAAGTGMAALAGCSGNGDNSTSTTESTQSTSVTDQTTTQTQTQGTGTEQYNDPNESPAEEQFEQELLNNNYAFIEVGSQNIQLNGGQTTSGGSSGYQEMLRDFQNFYSENVDQNDTVMIGYDLEVEGGSTDLVLRDFAQSESSGSVSDTSGYNGSYTNDAVETFFDRNISGVVDASENFPDNLLGLASE